MIHSMYLDEEGNLTTDLTKERMSEIVKKQTGVLWVDLENSRQIEAVEILSNIFKFHALAIEDCFHPLQYARVDSYGTYIFVVAHALKRQDSRVNTAEVDFFVGPNYVVSFRNEPLPALDQVIETMVKDRHRLQRGPDWLAHAIVDALVDGYLPVIEELTAKLDQLEEQALERSQRDTLLEIMSSKRDIVRVHQAAVPLRELISRLSREELPNIRPATQPYFRDVYDHIVRVSETSEILRETAEGALTIYAMSQNNRTNDVIKALAVIGTVGLAPVVIASIYGMNFDHMPELSWRFGYLFALVAMGAISAALFGFLKWKKWL